MSVPDTTSIRIAGDITVTVPASPRLMTTYILMEQQDWFEDEMNFIRSFIKSGMKVVDVGANYGCYTLTIAGITGDTGKVWAIEPTETTAICLRDSIRSNDFNNIELIQAGLSNKSGHAELFTSENSELNSLSSDAAVGNRHETIKLLTLDQCSEDYGWNNIDFIKLDAEGEEVNILNGGEATLATMSPLIMFELKHGDRINTPLIKRFNETGYSCYRLIPGLNILVPFDYTKPFDSFLLNLFCCKEDKARQLEESGIIVREYETTPDPDHGVIDKYLGSLPCAEGIDQQQEISEKKNVNEYLDILSAYIMALQQSTSSHIRIACLMLAKEKMRAMLASGEQDSARLTTFSRIAFDAGERQLGVRILGNLIKKHASDINFNLDEMFLPASRKYDDIVPGSRINAWLMSSIIEQYIIKSAYSTFFTRQRMAPLFVGLQRLGYMNEDMQRRYRLMATCFPQ